MKRVVISIAIVGAVVGAGCIGFLLRDVFPRQRKIHVLRQPLTLDSQTGDGNQAGMLPIGTTLECDRGFSEGFDRYCVFVNIEGSPLTLQDKKHYNEVTPLWGYSQETK